MALHWNWEECMGTCTDKNGNRVKLYRGNAFMIAIHEDDETNTYQLVWFFADRNHMKNCLGLNKGEPPCSFVNEWKHFHLNSYYNESFEFAKAVAKAKLETMITLEYWLPL